MQAIQGYNYDRLKKCLQELQRQSVIFRLPADHLNSIMQKEKDLKQLYNTYRLTLKKVSILIKQYEEENLSVRRLISKHKQYTKHMEKKKSQKSLSKNAASLEIIL